VIRESGLTIIELQCVSKNIPDIFSCNFRKHCRLSEFLAYILL